MLVLFLLCVFLQTLWGKPLPSPIAPSSGITANVTSVMAPQECPAAPGDGQQLRSIYDIVQSCLFTIFACVWTSIHPNINGPGDSWWTCMKRRVVTTVCAVIVPELVLLWALNQRFAAKKVADEYNKEFATSGETEASIWAKTRQLFQPHAESTRRGARQPWTTIHGFFTLIGGFIMGKLTNLFRPLPKPMTRRAARPPWTVTHGFFVQMGGFLLYEDGYPTEALTYKRLAELLRNGDIDAPTVTERELQDRSKGDTISKGVVVLQTLWFVLQCIVRAVQHLPLSELEVLTLAFAVLNGAIYAAWWGKPQGVDTAIPILSKREGNIVSDDSSASSLVPANSAPADDQDSDKQPLIRSNSQDSWLGRTLRKDRNQYSSPAFVLLRLPYRIIVWMLRPLNKMSGSNMSSKGPRISMFYAVYTKELGPPEHIALIIGLIFGAIHLLGWALEFPLPRDCVLWRASAVGLIVAPFVFLVADALKLALQDIPKWILAPLALLFIASIPSYIVARFVVIVIAFKGILHPPPRVLLDISWTRYIPHF